jgi:hypothetical protein
MEILKALGALLFVVVLMGSLIWLFMWSLKSLLNTAIDLMELAIRRSRIPKPGPLSKVEKQILAILEKHDKPR